MYEATTEYKLLSERWLEKAGAKPFIFLKTVDGSCTPHCEALQCLPQDGTPKALNGATLEEKFRWWSQLFAGFLNFVMKANPKVDLVHIWNEPNAVSCFLHTSLQIIIHVTTKPTFHCTSHVYLDVINTFIIIIVGCGPHVNTTLA